MNFSCYCSPVKAKVGKPIIPPIVTLANAMVTITNIITITVLFIFSKSVCILYYIKKIVNSL